MPVASDTTHRHAPTRLRSMEHATGRQPVVIDCRRNASSRTPGQHRLRSWPRPLTKPDHSNEISTSPRTSRPGDTVDLCGITPRVNLTQICAKPTHVLRARVHARESPSTATVRLLDAPPSEGGILNATSARLFGAHAAEVSGA